MSNKSADHLQQVGWMNVMFSFQEMKKGKWMWKDVYETKNQPKKETVKYDQEGRFCLGVAKVESKEYGKITGKRCPVLNYTGKKIVTIDAYKK